ncbi:MAG: hypothetical protein KDA52_18250 [Planctomycetaceae bacterium]|nr:hypothetical protein [Planctomycetaceae bacterium]
MRSGLFLSFISMVNTSHEAQRPASPEQDAHTSPAQRALKLTDGRLSATVFTKPKGKGQVHRFIIPERAYRNADEKTWTNTHLLHEEDLLPMAALLTRTYQRLRHQEQTGEQK